jgi:hypothetical protein
MIVKDDQPLLLLTIMIPPLYDCHHLEPSYTLNLISRAPANPDCPHAKLRSRAP